MDKLETQVAEVAKECRQLTRVDVVGDRVALEQLTDALLQNAIQSISPGNPSENWIVASIENDGAVAKLTIDDTGGGIRDADVKRVTDPFCTSRLDGSLGLGLAVSQEIVRQHGGGLELMPRPGGGTRVKVELPLASEGYCTRAPEGHTEKIRC